jgi:hypothetical protein
MRAGKNKASRVGRAGAGRGTHPTSKSVNTCNLILRSALSARLEGWMHGTDSLPSFETAA